MTSARARAPADAPASARGARPQVSGRGDVGPVGHRAAGDHGRPGPGGGGRARRPSSDTINSGIPPWPTWSPIASSTTRTSSC